jgi:prophage antirepressor-like protein
MSNLEGIWFKPIRVCLKNMSLLLSHFQFAREDQTLFPLRVYGTNDHPLFVAREIATILGLESSYRNFVATLDADERESAAVPTQGGRQVMSLISESAVYKMIFKSRKAAAIRFQNWICKEVIPAVRRQSTQHLQRQIQELNDRLETQQRATRQLGTYVENMRYRENHQFIYIATNRWYASQNHFKVGGCASQTLLRSRLSGYNCGRVEGDEMYYCALFPCHNYIHAEKRIKELLCDFRMHKEKEMYVLPYDILHKFLEKLMRHYQDEVEHLNTVLGRLLETVTQSVPIIPPPLTVSPPSVSTTTTTSTTTPVSEKPEETSPAPSQVLDLETLAESEQRQWIQKWVDTYRNVHPYPVIVRKSFEEFVEQQPEVTVKYRKLTLWNHLKSIANSVQDFTAKYL